MQNIHVNKGKQLSVTFANTKFLEDFVKEVNGRKGSKGNFVFRVKTFKGLKNTIINVAQNNIGASNNVIAQAIEKVN